MTSNVAVEHPLSLVREQGKSKFDGCDRLTGKLLENLALSPDPATRRCYAAQLPELVALQDIRYHTTDSLYLALMSCFSQEAFLPL